MPEHFSALILSVSEEPWVVLLLINLLLLIVGCFMETAAAISILVPILLPIAVKVGVDPVLFGGIMVLNLMIGLLTPPVWMVRYVLARVSKLPFKRLRRRRRAVPHPAGGRAAAGHLRAGHYHVAADAALPLSIL